MRVLILGGSGMLGHQLFHRLSLTHDVRVTLRNALSEYSGLGIFDESNAYPSVELETMDSLIEAAHDFSPQVVVNAVGFVRRQEDPENILGMMTVNSLLPRRLGQLCRVIGSRFIHMSTDGVFSGDSGLYRETDMADARDLYGKTKFLGEVYDSHCFTLRTSIIGRELLHKTSLLEWLRTQRGTVRGFSKVVFSGFTTLELARIIDDVITNHPYMAGLYHISSDPISKYDLLVLLKEKLNLPIEVVPDIDVKSNLSLDSTKFRADASYVPPSWEDMIDDLATHHQEVPT
jgi:dTDP-4-dehydrorhamnose reductase